MLRVLRRRQTCRIADDCTVRIWDAETGKAQHTFNDFCAWVQGVAFSSGGLLAATDFDIDTGRSWKTPADLDLCVDISGIYDISFSDDGKKLAAAIRDCIRNWQLAPFGEVVWKEAGYGSGNVSCETVQRRVSACIGISGGHHGLECGKSRDTANTPSRGR